MDNSAFSDSDKDLKSSLIDAEVINYDNLKDKFLKPRVVYCPQCNHKGRRKTLLCRKCKKINKLKELEDVLVQVREETNEDVISNFILKRHRNFIGMMNMLKNTRINDDKRIPRR